MAESATDEKLIDVLHFIAKERNIPFEMLLEALEAALLTAYKRHLRQRGQRDRDRRPADRRVSVFHRRTVVEDGRRSRSSRSP